MYYIYTYHYLLQYVLCVAHPMCDAEKSRTIAPILYIYMYVVIVGNKYLTPEIIVGKGTFLSSFSGTHAGWLADFCCIFVFHTQSALNLRILFKILACFTEIILFSLRSLSLSTHTFEYAYNITRNESAFT